MARVGAFLPAECSTEIFADPAAFIVSGLALVGVTGMAFAKPAVQAP